MGDELTAFDMDAYLANLEGQIDGQTIRGVGLMQDADVENQTIWFPRGELGRRVGFFWYKNVKLGNDYGWLGVAVEDGTGWRCGTMLDRPQRLSSYGVTVQDADDLALEDAADIFLNIEMFVAADVASRLIHHESRPD